MERFGQIVIIITVPIQISNFHCFKTIPTLYRSLILIAFPLIVKGGKRGNHSESIISLRLKKMSGTDCGLIINVMGLVMRVNIR